MMTSLGSKCIWSNLYDWASMGETCQRGAVFKNIFYGTRLYYRSAVLLTHLHICPLCYLLLPSLFMFMIMLCPPNNCKPVKTEIQGFCCWPLPLKMLIVWLSFWYSGISVLGQKHTLLVLLQHSLGVVRWYVAALQCTWFLVASRVVLLHVSVLVHFCSLPVHIK